MNQEVLKSLMEFPEVIILARTLCGEARGETLEGQTAIANVVLNRLKNKRRYGDNIHHIVLRPFQFSCWLESDPNFKKLTQPECYDSVQRVISSLAIRGLLIDNSKGATHYHAKQIVPYWIEDVTKMQKTVEIGNHIFYKEL